MKPETVGSFPRRTRMCGFEALWRLLYISIMCGSVEVGILAKVSLI